MTEDPKEVESEQIHSLTGYPDLDQIWNKLDGLAQREGLPPADSHFSPDSERPAFAAFQSIFYAVVSLYEHNPLVGNEAMDIFIDSLVENRKYEDAFNAWGNIPRFLSDPLKKQAIEHRDAKYNLNWAKNMYDLEIGKRPDCALDVAKGVRVSFFIRSYESRNDLASPLLLIKALRWEKLGKKACEKYGEALLAGKGKEQSKEDRYKELRGWLMSGDTYVKKHSEVKRKISEEYTLLKRELFSDTGG